MMIAVTTNVSEIRQFEDNVMLFDQRVRFSDNHSLASSNNKALTVGRCMVGVLVDVLLLRLEPPRLPWLCWHGSTGYTPTHYGLY